METETGMENSRSMKSILREDVIQVEKVLLKVLGKSKYENIERMGGLTNRTYKVSFSNGGAFVVRIPGEGTEELIIRRDEKVSTKLACDLGIDAKLLYFGDDGAKVTEFIPYAVTMSAESMKLPEHIRWAALIFRKLHSCNINTGIPFEVFDMAKGYEEIIFKNGVEMYNDYGDIKEKVMKIKEEVDAVCDIRKVPCHNDALCENWIMSGKERMYLVDWEYAGMNDGIWDLADVSIEASYDQELDEMLLTEYLGRKPTETDWKHFLANKLYVDYLWTLWAKTRVPYDGKPMEEWADMRYGRLKNNIVLFGEI